MLVICTFQGQGQGFQGQGFQGQRVWSFEKYSLGSFFLKLASCLSKISTPSASPTFFRLSSFQFYQNMQLFHATIFINGPCKPFGGRFEIKKVPEF